jgi:chromosome segregation ATPase
MRRKGQGLIRRNGGNASSANSAQKDKKSACSSKSEGLQEVWDYWEYVRSVSKRIESLENVTSQLDKILADSVVDLKIANDQINESNDELSNSLKDHLKHELSVTRREQKTYEVEFNQKINKAETEVNRIRGRVGSLVEEKNSLLKRVQSLEKENKTLQEKITQLTDNNNRKRKLSINRKKPCKSRTRSVRNCC